MTLLQLVNAVLYRLREETLTALGDNAYDNMLVAQVNDAKRFVESAWDWHVLRDTQNLTITAGSSSQVLEDSDAEMFKILRVYNKDGKPCQKITLDQYRRIIAPVTPAATGTVQKWWMQPPSRGARTKTIGLWPAADVNQGLTVDYVWSQPDLAAATDELLVPSLPVILFATTYAARERGEAGGTSVQEWMALAKQALGDAISADTVHYDEDLVWTDGSVWPNSNRT